MTFGEYDEELKSQLKTMQFDDEVKDHVQVGTEGCVCWRDWGKRVVCLQKRNARGGGEYTVNC